MRIIILLLFIVKITLLVLFSSDYQNQLFIPFVKHFIAQSGNPWEYFYLNQIDAFPYHPLMLYIVSLFYLPFQMLAHNSILLQNLFFKLPTLFSDILIVYLLYKLFPNKLKEITIFYVASPIIIYASYMHSQLDLVPTAILFLSTYLLITKRTALSALIFSCALSTKLHVIAALPLMIVYILRTQKRRNILSFIVIPAVVYSLISLPYIFSKGYFFMVLANQKQQLMFDVFYKMGNLKIYFPLFAFLAIIARFIAYKKINNDLFYAFLGILFSVLVLTIIPAPGWYIWMLPFLCTFFIKFYKQEKKTIYLYIILNLAYIIYFVFFFVPDHPDLTFLTTPLSFKIDNERLRDLSFTFLETALFVTIYFFYKFGVKSNLLYSKDVITAIGISGDSGVGKTTLSSDIGLLLGDRLQIIEGDADHKWERDDEHWQKIAHLDPKANFLYRQAENILRLKQGKTIYRVDYDHRLGKFTKEKEIHARDFIIMSGLHTFYLPIMREILDLKIYVDTDERIRRRWKIARDIQERNYGKEAIVTQIEKRTEEAEKYIYPQREYADMVINYFTEDDFEIGDANYCPQMKLKIIFDSSIDIEALVNRLSSYKIDLIWDYAYDLKTQYIIFGKTLDRYSKYSIESIARESIANIEEIACDRLVWLDGFRGMTQLFVLLVLSEMIKKGSQLK